MDTQIDKWSFEVVQIRARKTDKFGMPYSAILNITIVDGEPHIEGLLSTDGFSISDYKTIKQYIKSLGFSSCKYAKGVAVVDLDEIKRK